MRRLRFLTAGESHGKALTALLEGVPAGLDLEVRPLVPDCELDGRTSTGVVYWEGPVEAAGSTTGEGYVELTGYAGTMEDRF